MKLLFHKFGNIREAKISDAVNLFNLSNDLLVRRNSLNPKKISWKSHIRWLKKKLDSHDYVIYIVSIFRFFIGQVRFEICKNYKKAVISISLVDKIRGSGLSNLILKKSIQKFIDKKNIRIIKAYVLTNNRISERSFIRAGFTYNRMMELKNRKVKTFIKKLL